MDQRTKSIRIFLFLFTEVATKGILQKRISLKVLQNSQEHLCQNLFFNTGAGLRPAKKETLAQVFSCEFWKVFMNTFFNRTPLDECFCPYLTSGKKAVVWKNSVKWLLRKILRTFWEIIYQTQLPMAEFPNCKNDEIFY